MTNAPPRTRRPAASDRVNLLLQFATRDLSMGPSATWRERERKRAEKALRGFCYGAGTVFGMVPTDPLALDDLVTIQRDVRRVLEGVVGPLGPPHPQASGVFRPMLSAPGVHFIFRSPPGQRLRSKHPLLQLAGPPHGVALLTATFLLAQADTPDAFGRCAGEALGCQTPVFVRAGRQTFCSLACRMRGYMRTYRTKRRRQASRAAPSRRRPVTPARRPPPAAASRQRPRARPPSKRRAKTRRRR